MTSSPLSMYRSLVVKKVAFSWSFMTALVGAAEVRLCVVCHTLAGVSGLGLVGEAIEFVIGLCPFVVHTDANDAYDATDATWRFTLCSGRVSAHHFSI